MIIIHKFQLNFQEHNYSKLGDVLEKCIHVHSRL
jgi:hypothetical protein